MSDEFNLNCPVPLSDHTTVQLAHGGGGRLMRNLIESVFLPALSHGLSTLDSQPSTLSEGQGEGRPPSPGLSTLPLPTTKDITGFGGSPD